MKTLTKAGLALCAILFSLATQAAPTKTEIIMGFNPAENTDVVDMNSKLFGDYFKKQTGISVKTFIATDYTALIEALRSQQIDFAWLPPFSFVKAEEVAQAHVLLKAVRKGKAHFFSCIVTRTDSPFHKFEDLKGKNIAWVDPSSTSGHIFPKASLMAKKKIDPDTFFGKQIFAGSHDSLVLSVLNGTVDAGATFCDDADGKTGSWNQFLKSDQDKTRIRVLYVTAPITGDTMATSEPFIKAHKDVVDSTVKLMIAMGKTDEGRKILSALYRIDSMIPANTKDYDAVRDAARALKIMK